MRLAAALVVAFAVAGAAGGAVKPRVTIHANTNVSGAGGTIVLLGGTVSSGRPGERVTVEADDCGPLSWRPVWRVRTGDHGGWASNGDTNVNTRYRARWKKVASRPIHVYARPQVTLRTNGAGFYVEVLALEFFDRRTAVLQQYNVASRKWRDVARTKLRRDGAAAELGRSSGTFRVAGHGRFRAVLPAAQAAPCYAAGVSPNVNS